MARQRSALRVMKPIRRVNKAPDLASNSQPAFANSEKLAFSVEEAARISGLSPSFIYQEWQGGRGPSRIKAGKQTLILADTLQEWLRTLETKPSAPPVAARNSPVGLASGIPKNADREQQAAAILRAVQVWLSEHANAHEGVGKARLKKSSRWTTKGLADRDVPFNERITCTVRDACIATGLGRTKLYEMIGAGVLQTTAAGRRRLIVVASLAKCLPRKDLELKGESTS